MMSMAASSLATKQDSSANLVALAGLSGTADQLPYFTGSGALALASLTASARTLLEAADAAAQRTAMGLISYLACDSYAAVTAYSLTNSAAAIVFGTTSPSLTISTAGTYRLSGRAVLKYNGATFAANQTVTLKFRRTNNTAADLANGGVSLITSIITAITGPLGIIVLPDIEYVAGAADIVTIFGSVGTAPSLGSLDVTDASLHAIRVA